MAARVALIKFSASWCGPCHACMPAFAQLQAELAAGVVDFHEVDVDRDKATASAYKVRSMPTFIVLLDGLEVTRIVGANMEKVRGKLFGVLQANPPELPPHRKGTPDNEDSDSNSGDPMQGTTGEV
jgi:thioredoxin 1